MKTVMEQFCDGCQFYKPDWDSQVDSFPMPCKLKHICGQNARKAEIIIKDGKE
jgi:hypothetical protein